MRISLFATIAGLASIASFTALPSFASQADQNPATGYAQTASSRARNIVEKLDLFDKKKAERVAETISRQYQELNAIHSARDAKKEEAKKLTDETAKKAAIAAANAQADEKVAKLHPEYLARLAQDLTPEQIDAVKDGMTYGVLPLTYRVYQEMIPNLTSEQKKQILDWLTEAREKAMDAGSSHEKHAWFGKYKGKINNYLSAAGVDLKEAEKNLRKKKS